MARLMGRRSGVVVQKLSEPLLEFCALSWVTYKGHLPCLWPPVQTEIAHPVMKHGHFEGPFVNPFAGNIKAVDQLLEVLKCSVESQKLWALTHLHDGSELQTGQMVFWRQMMMVSPARGCSRQNGPLDMQPDQRIFPI